MSNYKTYTLGQIVDKLEVGEVAVCINSDTDLELLNNDVKDYIPYNLIMTDKPLWINPNTRVLEFYNHSRLVIVKESEEVKNLQKFIIMPLEAYERELNRNNKEEA